MGLLKHLLFWPVTGPTALARFSLGQIEAAVHRELTDDERVKEDLLELQLLLELGDIDEEEFLERETRLMDRLRQTREWREHLGIEPAWSPLTVPRGQEPPEEEPSG